MTDGLGHVDTLVVLAVVGQARPTVRSVAAAIDRCVSSTHGRLVRLRALGLVDWVEGRQGTLHATVAAVS